MKGELVYIYALCEPSNRMEPRYIGKALDVDHRYYRHIWNAKNRLNANFPKEHWIRDLIKKGKEPTLKILRQCTSDDWEYWETKLIKEFKEAGHKLFNILSGGEWGGTTQHKKIHCYDLKGNYVKSFESISQAARLVGGAKGNISLVANGKAYISYGYQWRFNYQLQIDPINNKKPRKCI